MTGLNAPEAKAWAARNGLGEGLAFSHNLSRVFPPALFDEHPEYFPWEEGKRIRPPEGSHWWNPDLGREDVAGYAARTAAEYFAANPEAESFALGVNDALIFGESPELLRWAHPPRWFRGRPDYSDLVFNFMNRAAAQLAETHPGKHLGALAYYWCENTPQFAVVPNVVPFLTADRSQGYDRGFAAEERALQRRWAKAGPHRLGLYDYVYGGGFLVPRIHPQLLAENLRQARRLGFTDYFAEANPNWGLDGPQPWLVAQLLLNPEQSADRLLDEYFRRFFREAAGPMRKFFARCEELWLRQSGPVYWLKHYRNESQAALFPPEACAELRSYLTDAETIAPDDLVRARVRLTSEAFAVTEALVRMQGARGRLVSTVLELGERKEGARSWELGARSSKLGAESWELPNAESGGRRTEEEAGGGKPEARSQNLESRSQNPEASSLSPLASGQSRTEAGGGKPEARSQNLESRSQNPEASSLSPMASGQPRTDKSQEVGAQSSKLKTLSSQLEARSSKLGAESWELLEEFLDARAHFLGEVGRVRREQPLALHPVNLDDYVRNRPEFAAARAILAAEQGRSPEEAASLRERFARHEVPGVRAAALVDQAVQSGEDGVALLLQADLSGNVIPGRRIAGLIYGVDLPDPWQSVVEPSEPHRAALIPAAARSGPVGLRIAGSKDTAVYQWVPVSENQIHAGSVWVRGQVSPSTSVALTLGWLDEGQRHLGGIVLARLPEGSWKDWVRLEIGDFVPANAHWVGLGVRVQHQTAEDWVEVADFELRGFPATR